MNDFNLLHIFPFFSKSFTFLVLRVEYTAIVDVCVIQLNSGKLCFVKNKRLYYIKIKIHKKKSGTFLTKFSLENMASLRKQASLLNAFKRIKLFSKNATEESCEIAELEQRIKSLKKNWEEFKNLQDTIEEECGIDQMEIQFVARNQAEEYYFSAYSDLKTLHTALCGPSVNNINHPVGEVSENTDIKLPRITLPVFDGDYKDWTLFESIFTDLIHNSPHISNSQKLHYLKANVKGSAAELIKSFAITDENYAEAWAILENRYNNKRFIIDLHLKTFFNMPNLSSESASGIRKLVDTSGEVFRQLATLGIPIQHWDVILVHILVDKIDSETRRQWELKLVRNVLPSFKDLLNFLEARWQSLELCHAGTSKGTGPFFVKKPSNKSSTAFLATNAIKCEFCDAEHFVFKCNVFLKLNFNERTKMVRDKNLCFNCLWTHDHHLANRVHANIVAENTIHCCTTTITIYLKIKKHQKRKK